MRNLLLQFDIFFDKIVEKKSTNKKFNFRLCMLETTQYNYKESSKYYKELIGGIALMLIGTGVVIYGIKRNKNNK